LQEAINENLAVDIADKYRSCFSNPISKPSIDAHELGHGSHDG